MWLRSGNADHVWGWYIWARKADQFSSVIHIEPHAKQCGSSYVYSFMGCFTIVDHNRCMVCECHFP